MILVPTHAKQRTSLNADSSAWVETQQLPDELIQYAENHFEEMLQLGQDGKKCTKIVMNGNEVPAHRTYQSYGNTPALTEQQRDCRGSYMFSDLSGQKQEIPPLFQPIIDYVNNCQGKVPYNQFVINWYQDGNEYTPYHRDWYKGMAEESDIVTVSLTPKIVKESEYRTFGIILMPKFEKKLGVIHSKVDIVATNGSMIRLGGKNMQKHFFHGVPREPEKLHPRISISFRRFDDSKPESIVEEKPEEEEKETEQKEEYRMLIVVLASLRPGKAISQACHAVHQITMKFERELLESTLNCTLPAPECMQYQKWNFEPTKIVLSATADQLIQLANKHDNVIPIVDFTGDLYVPPGTLVCIGFAPMLKTQCDFISKDFKLF